MPSGLVATKDKVVKLKKVESEAPAAVAVEDAGDERVTKAEGDRCKLVDN